MNLLAIKTWRFSRLPVMSTQGVFTIITTITTTTISTTSQPTAELHEQANH